MFLQLFFIKGTNATQQGRMVFTPKHKKGGWKITKPAPITLNLTYEKT